MCVMRDANTRAALLWGESVRCSGCGRVVGIRHDGRLTVRHKGREVVIEPAAAVVRIRCEECGTSTRIGGG